MLDKMFLEKNDRRRQQGRLCRVASKLILSFSTWSHHRRALIWTYDNLITSFCAEAKLMFIPRVQWLISSGQSMAAKQWSTILVIVLPPVPFLHIAKQRKLCGKYPDVLVIYLRTAHVVLWKGISWAPTFPCGFFSLSLVSCFAGSLNELQHCCLCSGAFICPKRQLWLSAHTIYFAVPAANLFYLQQSNYSFVEMKDLPKNGKKYDTLTTVIYFLFKK